MCKVSLLVTRWAWDALLIAAEAVTHATLATNIIVKKVLRSASIVGTERAE